MSKLLLLSNSTLPGQSFFAWAKDYLKLFSSNFNGYVAFVPYAAVGFSYDAYEDKVQQAWQEIGLKVESIHRATNKKAFIEEASAIAVGGGNTFALLNMLYKEDLIKVIVEKVANDTPYIGWSAGANMACPSIKTTNDMPITEPESFNALNLIPFQINPHYTEQRIPGHGGESRVERIKEFLTANQQLPVLGLPEGMLIEKNNNKLSLQGEGEAVLHRFNQAPVSFSKESDISFLL